MLTGSSTTQASPTGSIASETSSPTPPACWRCSFAQPVPGGCWSWAPPTATRRYGSPTRCAAWTGTLRASTTTPAAVLRHGQNLLRAGLGELVDLRVEDAAITLRESPDRCWDMIFLDAERPAYTGYWPDLVRVLRPGGLLAVDNVLSHAAELGDLRRLVRAEDRVTEAVVPSGAGMLLVVLDPNTD